MSQETEDRQVYKLYYPTLSLDEFTVELTDEELASFKEDPVAFYEEELAFMDLELHGSDVSDIPVDNPLFYIELQDEERNNIIMYPQSNKQ